LLKITFLGVILALLLLCTSSYRCFDLVHFDDPEEVSASVLEEEHRHSLDGFTFDYERFKEFEIGDMIVFFCQREIDEAIVEKDFTVYSFDKNSGELLAKESHWRNDLPEYLPQHVITKEQAESKVQGDVQFCNLYIISPESDVFPVEPTPNNPCWVVRSIDNGYLKVTVIDAVDGTVLGNGIPPPYTAFSMSGPCYFDPCSYTWYAWYKNAEFWLSEMGYSTEALEWPTEEKIKSHIQSNETAMFYEIAHSEGRSDQFKSGCTDGTLPEYTYAYEIEEWISNYTKMPFTFLASCFSMCNTTDDSLSYEFRKGSTKNTVTIGYCNMSGEQCQLCWTYSLDWQDSLFNYMNQSYTVKQAFDMANLDYPVCAECMRFAGDERFRVIPKVERIPFEHDVALTDLSFSKNIVGEGYPFNLTLFIENEGGHAEVFNMTVYANTTVIGEFENLILSRGAATILALTVNTTGMTKGNYIIKVCAAPVPEEIDIEDNTVTSDAIAVTIPGDVDGNFQVDIYDVVKLCNHYGYERSDHGYDADCDIDGDGHIDIYDVVTMCNHYGETYA